LQNPISRSEIEAGGLVGDPLHQPALKLSLAQ